MSLIYPIYQEDLYKVEKIHLRYCIDKDLANRTPLVRDATYCV